LQIKQVSDDKTLEITSFGQKQKDGSFEVAFKFADQMEHINGDYQLTLHAADIDAANNFIWSLGTIKLWFKEGVSEGNNLGIKPEFSKQ